MVGKELNQAEKLLESWVKINSLIKNSRITKGLSYNESIIMMYLYKQHIKGNDKGISIKEIITQTNMLKSLVTRTINSLEQKSLLEKCEGETDKRTVYVRIVQDNIDTFLKVHQNSVLIASKIIEIIGTEDADNFIKIINKVEKAQEKLF